MDPILPSLVDAPSALNSNWTVLRMGAARLARQQNNFTLASKLLIQQFQSTYAWPTGSSMSQSNSAAVGSPLRSLHSDISSVETYSLTSLKSMIERQQNSQMISIELETETAKLMHALSLNKANNVNISIAIEFLSRSILRHLINENQVSSSYNPQRSLINIEKCSRNLLHIAKWSRTATENNFDTMSMNTVSLVKLHQLRKQYLMNRLGLDIAAGLKEICGNNVDDESFLEPFVRKYVPMEELLIGEILDFSTITGPGLGKTWFRFADWAYGWGRQILARSLP